MSVEIHLNLNRTSPWAGIPDGWMERQSELSTSTHRSMLPVWMDVTSCFKPLSPWLASYSDYTIELWAETNPFPLHCFCEAVLLQQQEEKLRQTIAGFTNGDHGSLGLMVYLIENNVTFSWEIPYLSCLLKAFLQALNLKAGTAENMYGV